MIRRGDLLGGEEEPRAWVSPEEAWSRYQEEQRRAEDAAEQRRKAAAAAQAPRAAEAARLDAERVERYRLAAERRAAAEAQEAAFRLEHGNLWLTICHGDDDLPDVEVRRRHEGDVEVIEIVERDPWSNVPVRVSFERFADLSSALKSALADFVGGDPYDAPTFETDDETGLQEALRQAGLAGVSFRLEDEIVTFDGHDIVDADFAAADSLPEQEDALHEVWSFHAGMSSGGPFVREAYETIGHSRGVYFYVHRIEHYGDIVRLGRFPTADAAIDAGLAISVRADEERAAMLEADEDL